MLGKPCIVSAVVPKAKNLLIPSSLNFIIGRSHSDPYLHIRLVHRRSKRTAHEENNMKVPIQRLKLLRKYVQHILLRFDLQLVPHVDEH